MALITPSRSPANDADVPVVKGELGPCTADFTVTDSSGRPLYDAKIHVQVVYGFMSKRKTDLEVGTNGEGKARFEGLPDKVKKPPLEFQVRYGGLQPQSIALDPAVNCRARFTVALNSK
jgi:hypothetical protein